MSEICPYIKITKKLETSTFFRILKMNTKPAAIQGAPIEFTESQ